MSSYDIKKVYSLGQKVLTEPIDDDKPLYERR